MMGKRDLPEPEAQKCYPKCSAFLPQVQCDQGPTNCLEETSRAEYSYQATHEGHTYIKLVFLDQLLLSPKTTQKLSSPWQPKPRDTALGMNILEQQGSIEGGRRCQPPFGELHHCNLFSNPCHCLGEQSSHLILFQN